MRFPDINASLAEIRDGVAAVCKQFPLARAFDHTLAAEAIVYRAAALGTLLRG